MLLKQFYIGSTFVEQKIEIFSFIPKILYLIISLLHMVCNPCQELQDDAISTGQSTWGISVKWSIEDKGKNG